jgi:hypothetical protein
MVEGDFQARNCEYAEEKVIYQPQTIYYCCTSTTGFCTLFSSGKEAFATDGKAYKKSCGSWTISGRVVLASCS